jgi:hypothetical protein
VTVGQPLVGEGWGEGATGVESMFEQRSITDRSPCKPSSPLS